MKATLAEQVSEAASPAPTPPAAEGAAAQPAPAEPPARPGWLTRSQRWARSWWHRGTAQRYAHLPGARLAAQNDAGADPLGWEPYRLALARAKISADPADRQNFLSEVWGAQIAPHLRHEEAVMQLIAHHLAYLYVEPGQEWPLSITDSWADLGEPRWRDGTPVAYAERYHVAHVLPEPFERAPLAKRLRLSAFFMLPDRGAAGPAIILFRGTNFRSDLLTLGDPLGFAQDLDPTGVGYEAFGANAATLHDWVAAAQEEGRGIVLVGHSLGAALATRLLASLPPDTQAHVRLLAFSPPGLEASCIEGIALDGAQITTVLHGGDYVPLAGQRLAPGRVLEVRAPALVDPPSRAELMHFHVYPYLAAWLLRWSEAPDVLSWASERIYTDRSGISERARATVGAVTRNNFAALSWLSMAPPME